MDVISSLVVESGVGERFVFSGRLNTKFEDFMAAVLAKWPEYRGGPVCVRYSVCGIENCSLDSDFDWSSMCVISQQLGAKVFNVKVTARSDAVYRENSEIRTQILTGQQGDLGRGREQPGYGSPTFNQISTRAFGATVGQDHIEKGFENRKRRFDQASGDTCGFVEYPEYDVCPRTNDKPLLSDPWETSITGVGQEFPGGAKQFRAELIKYAAINGFKYNFQQNGKRRIYVVCDKHFETQPCPWFIRAGEARGGMGEFVIKKSHLAHTCELVVGSHDTGRLGAELLSTLIESEVRDNPKIRGKDVKRLFEKAYGLDIAYKQAWRALEAARDKLFGSFEESFEHLRWYLEVLLKTNPGSVVKLEQNPVTGRFERAFIAFAATVEGFKSCRPMLFIDGMFMRGRWKGTILSATAKDGNNVAFAMVQGETTANWKWFLQLIKDNVEHTKPIYYISDRNTGLLAAFPEVWENPLNFYCMVHLFKNLKGLFGQARNEGFKIKMCGLLKRCVYAPTQRLFNTEMKEFITVGGAKAEEWVKTLEPAKWAVAFAPNLLRYGEMTSNAAESFNHWIKDARALPITFMVDCIRLGIMRWFIERRAAAEAWTSRLTARMQNKWNTSAHLCKHWGVLEVPSGKYEVRSVPNAELDLVRKQCTCYQWQVTGFPCPHAIALVIKKTHTITGVVADYYFKSTYLAAYAGDIHAVPETERFEFSNTEGHPLMLPPEKIVERGRTKQKRIPSFGEFQQRKPWTCRICKKKVRHDEATCGLAA